MDDSERIVQNFLQNIGYRSIIFEPDGNIPPDFLVELELAIECRRINQNVFVNGSTEGLEHAEAAIFRKMKAFVESFGPPLGEQSWWISYTVHRPMPEWKKTRRQLQEFFHYILAECPTERIEYKTAQGFSVDASPAGISLPTVFRIGGYSDHDAGGFVVSELIRNIQICVDEKTTKITTLSQKYPRWWLILVDRTNLGIDAEDVPDIAANVEISDVWENVILINPSNPHYGHGLKTLTEPESP